MVVVANNLYISLTIQLNSTAVTSFEFHINEEVDNDNKLYKWYERFIWYEQSMVRIVNGTKSPDTRVAIDAVVRQALYIQSPL